MDVKECRRQKLIELAGKFRNEGGYAEISRRCDVAAAYLSQIATKAPASNGRPRTMGDKLARKIEEKLGHHHGWMDTPEPTITSINETASSYATLDQRINALPEPERHSVLEALAAAETTVATHAHNEQQVLEELARHEMELARKELPAIPDDVAEDIISLTIKLHKSKDAIATAIKNTLSGLFSTK